jgi:hypothetical protein
MLIETSEVGVWERYVARMREMTEKILPKIYPEILKIRDHLLLLLLFIIITVFRPLSKNKINKW